MDPVQSLIREASEVSRRLWSASQTWTSRVEHVFTALLSFEEEGFEAKAANVNLALGKSFAAMFLIQGVTGMQPIKGEDALQWVEKWKAAKNVGSNWSRQVSALSSALPSNYGADIAGPLYAHALSILGNRANAEELLQDTFMHFFEGAGQSIHGAFHSAQKLVKNWVEWRATNRAGRGRREKSLTKGPDDENEGAETELVDETHDLDDLLHRARTDAKYKKLWDIIFTDPKLKAELEHVHPDTLQYLHLVGEGHTQSQILGVTPRNEIIGDSMLAHPFIESGKRMSYQNWDAKKKKMFATILRHFAQHGEHEHEVREHMHLAYDYDRRAAVTPPKSEDVEEGWQRGRTV